MGACLFRERADNAVASVASAVARSHPYREPPRTGTTLSIVGGCEGDEPGARARGPPYPATNPPGRGPGREP